MKCNYSQKTVGDKRDGVGQDKAQEDPAAKHDLKDSVFSDLFSDKQYLLQLYQALHPEDTEATEDDLTDVTIKNVFLNGIYNDIGFQRGDRFIILVECQVKWSMNILVRVFFYLAETYQRYVKKHDMDLYGTKKVKLPEPELYMLYIGDRKDRPEHITLSEEFFAGKDTALDLKVKVLYGDKKEDVIGQYVFFIRIYNEQYKKYGRTEKAVQEAIRICKDRNVLKDYLESREKEVIRIMSLLFDMDEIQRIHDVNIENEARKDEREKATKIANENGIRALVKICQEFGASIADTISKVMANYDMGEQEADSLVRKYWQSM